MGIYKANLEVLEWLRERDGASASGVGGLEFDGFT